jgi:phosphoglycerol transferase MdoB-like AlkP superfamily enzyme
MGKHYIAFVMDAIIELLIYITDWRGKRKAKKEGKEYGISIAQYLSIILLCLVVVAISLWVFVHFAL